MIGYRLCRKSFVFDLILVILLVYLIYAFVRKEVQQRQELNSFSKDSIHSRVKLAQAVHHRYDKRLNPPADYRPPECQSKSYAARVKVTLISYFYNFQFYDLKLALTSALYKNDGSIGEVIVVDDGTSENEVLENVKEFFETIIVPFKLLRNAVQQGKAKAMEMALEETRYDEVVFMESSVLCSYGWLPPLLEEIVKNPNTIAVPHFDRIPATISGKYEPVGDNTVAYVQWNLNTVLRANANPSDFKSPGLHPDFFVAKKSYLKSINSFDDAFQLGGGETLELGMRVWSCGGSITVASCSRVGLTNFDKTIRIASGANLRRIVGLWFLNNSDIYLPLSRHFQPTPDEQLSIQARKKTFDKCRNAGWYFANILKKTTNLESNVKQFGYLRVRSGSCASAANDFKINVDGCPVQSNLEVKDEFLFQLTSEKKLIVKGKCLTAVANMYVVLGDCLPDNDQQLWEINGFKLISNTNLCATHVTDPDVSNPTRQIVMVQNCQGEKAEHEQFRQWDFLPV